MLRNLEWLNPGQAFPPLKERNRIKRYIENEALFDGEHFGEALRFRDGTYTNEGTVSVYQKCANRISQVIGNFDDVISFPVLLNYQRLMTLKMADLVCGEYPSITGENSEDNNSLKTVRDFSKFDAKLYSTVIDISRYGDAVWRIYLDDDHNKTFTCWDPKEWFPIVSQDGTNTILAHVLCWRVNLTESADDLQPEWELHAQIHWATGSKVGTYEHRIYALDSSGSSISQLKSSKIVRTGLDICAVFNIKAFGTTSTVYGYDDYMPIDSILAEIMTRIGQISVILDKHADPNITGPSTMLSQNPITGEYFLKAGKFFAVSVGEQEPKYMTWDGQLSAAFQELEFLVNQLYILSEMGAALLGGNGTTGDAISGTALRFKMVNPLAKARRIANSLTEPVRRLFSELTAEDKKVDFEKISVFWSDGLPDDPTENIENCKLATGVTKMMPLEVGIMEYFGRSNEEAKQWVEQIKSETEDELSLASTIGGPGDSGSDSNPNKPGPQDGTGVNPQKRGSTTGVQRFRSDTNKKDGK